MAEVHPVIFVDERCKKIQSQIQPRAQGASQLLPFYLSVNTQFMTALRRLQGALLTAFQPIYEVVVPALTALINILSRAIATVTQFFASLSTAEPKL